MGEREYPSLFDGGDAVLGLVDRAEAALRAFDEYWGDGGPVAPSIGRPYELIRALLAEVRASERQAGPWLPVEQEGETDAN